MIEWVLILSICYNASSCIYQEVSSFKEEKACIETKLWYEYFPKDKQSNKNIIIYTCKPRDSHEI